MNSSAIRESIRPSSPRSGRRVTIAKSMAAPVIFRRRLRRGDPRQGNLRWGRQCDQGTLTLSHHRGEGTVATMARHRCSHDRTTARPHDVMGVQRRFADISSDSCANSPNVGHWTTSASRRSQSYLRKGCHVKVQRAVTKPTMPQIPSTMKVRNMSPVPTVVERAVCID